jgi:hypothetical protein
MLSYGSLFYLDLPEKEFGPIYPLPDQDVAEMGACPE